MIKECLDSLENNGRCIIKGKINGKEVCYTGSYPMDILGELNWDNLISNDYFKFVDEVAKCHIKNPTAYEKTMWRIARGEKEIEENEETIFMFACWIEDKYNAKEVANIIKKYALLDEFKLKFNCEDEDKKKKYNTIVEESKICLAN